MENDILEIKLVLKSGSITHFNYMHDLSVKKIFI